MAVKNLLRRFNGFDYVVLAGLSVNILVVFMLVGYWFLH